MHKITQIEIADFPNFCHLNSNSEDNRMIRSCSVLMVKHSKASFEKNCFSAWASTLNMGLINKVDMACLSPVGYGV